MIQPFNALLFALTLFLVVALSPSAFAQTAPTAPAPAADQTTAGGQLTPPPSTDPNQPQVLTVDQLLQLLNDNVNSGNKEAMITLGIIYERGQFGVDVNYGTALDWFQKAAAADVPEGYFNLGYFYQVGAGTAPDPAKALQNYLKASELGLPLANLRLGNIYLQGKLGVKQDYAKAIDYLTKAGQQGVQDADWQLSSIYLNGGEGFTPNTAKGMQILNSLAEKNYAQAINELGAIYYLGQWNQKIDKAKAKGYFIRAADLVHSIAMKNLAAYYRNDGDNGTPNATNALQWAILSLNFGQNTQEMAAFIQQLRNEMKPEEIQAAEAAAQDWAQKKIAQIQAEQAAQQQAQQQAQQNTATAPAGGTATPAPTPPAPPSRPAPPKK
jgi:TPR repeat protein